MECAAHRDGTAQNKSLRPFGCRLFLMGSGWGPAAYCALAADAGADAGAAAGALAAGSGACTASAPCFSPPMSALSPALMITNIASAANAIKPTTIFHIINISLDGFAQSRGLLPAWFNTGWMWPGRMRHQPSTNPSPLMEHRAQPLRAGPAHRLRQRISRWRRCRCPWFP